MAPKIDTKRLTMIRRVIYLLVALAVVVPYLFDMGLSFEPSRDSLKAYKALDSLPRGSRVLVAMDFDPASEAELRPMGVALLTHCFQKGLVPVVMTHWNNGLTLVESICRQAAKAAGKDSGKDWVFLGYRPGYADLVLNMGENFKGAFGKDFYGKSTQEMPALAGINTLKDFNFLVDIAAGNTVEMWIVYAADRHKLPFVAGTTAVMAPDMYPWLNSGQMAGLLGGLRGAADYEQLVKQPAAATKGMQVQSVGHVLLIALILAANVHFLLRRARGGEA